MSGKRTVKFPPTLPLLEKEKQLVWKFRFCLMSEKKYLTKFVCSVDWSDIKEAKQALKLIGKWETIDVADALVLLSPEFEREEASHLGTFVCAYFLFYVYVL